MPRAVHAVVPYSLQIGGHTAWTRGGDQQITPELEIHGLETRVRIPLPVSCKPFRRRQRVIRVFRPWSQVKDHPAVQLPVVLHVPRQKPSVSKSSRLAHEPGCHIRRIFPTVGRRISEIRVEIHPVVRSRCKDEHSFAGAGHGQAAVIMHRNSPSVRDD